MDKCKPGDMAFILNAIDTKEIIGHIVEVVGLYKGRCWPELMVDSGSIWEIRYPDGRDIMSCLPGMGYKKIFVKSRPFGDLYLCPIRPSEEEDEMLKITGLPIPRFFNAYIEKNYAYLVDTHKIPRRG